MRKQPPQEPSADDKASVASPKGKLPKKGNPEDPRNASYLVKHPYSK